MSLLDNLLSVALRWYYGGTTLPTRSTVELVGAASVEDDAVNERTKVTITSLAFGATLPENVSVTTAATGSDASPAHADHRHNATTSAAVSIGAANAEGDSNALARANHVHNHDAQTDPTHHALATGNTAGFMAAFAVANFAPTVTLVGGTGNTVPVYTTNMGRYVRIGNLVFVTLLLIGDGGADGAGSGTINIALPIESSANQPPVLAGIGNIYNPEATNAPCFAWVDPEVSTCMVMKLSAGMIAAATGDDQSSSNRGLSLSFFYEV